MGTSAILSPHVSDDAILTVSSEVSTLPGAHLQTPEAWQMWRASSNTARINLTFDAVRPINALAMISLRHTTAAMWRVLWAFNAFDLIYTPNVALDWTVISASGQPDTRRYPNWRRFVKFPEVQAGAIAVEISDPTNGGAIEAWRLLVGKLFQPVGGIDQDLGRPIESADVQEVRYGGGRATGARGRVLGKSYQWSALTRAEADELQDISLKCGSWRDVLFMLDPDDTARLQRDSILGPFAPGYPDMADIPLWDGDGSDTQLCRASVRNFESNAT